MAKAKTEPAPAEPETIEGEVMEDQPEPQEVRHLPVPAAPAAGGMTLFRTSDPVEVVKQAGEVAKALKDVLDKQNLIQKITIKGRTSEHVRVEGWTLLGSMLGVYPVVVWTRIVKDDQGRRLGWEAKVEARTRAGEIVGSAEAECLRHEERWKAVDDYAIRSMAQTRAVSKALKNPLGFVVSMAGFNTTPAEEAEGIADGAGAPAEGGEDKPTIRDPEAPASDKQVKLVAMLAGKLGLKGDDRHAGAEKVIKRKIRSFKDLKKGEASAIIDAWQKAIDAGETGGGGAEGEASPSAPDPESTPPPSTMDEQERSEWTEVKRQLEAGELEEGAVLDTALNRAAEIHGNRNKVLMAFNKSREPGNKARSTKQIPPGELITFLLGSEG